MTMAAHMLTFPDRRDIARYLRLRDGVPDDDLVLAGLLVRTFTETYAEKLPEVATDARRVVELVGVAQRRQAGVVRVLDFGYRVIGTYSLIRPGTCESHAWRGDAATLRCLAIDPEFHGLRFSTILLRDAETIARSWGCAAICLQVQNGADGVARTYEAYGYRRDVEGDQQNTNGGLLGFTMPLTAEALRGP